MFCFAQKVCQSYLQKSTHWSLLQLSKRTILSESYACNDAWDKFITSDLMKKHDIATLSVQLDDRLNKKQLVTPLDMDILATKLVFAENIEQVEYTENVFLKFRKTQASIFARESMHHAFIRSYIDLGLTQKLTDIFALKYKYGIFLDNFTANMLMDLFIKEKNYENGAQIAIEVMLQEFTQNELTLALSMLTSWNYLSRFKIEDGGEPEPVQNDEDVKVTKVLVNYLRNSYFDDHFDLKDFEKLSSKALHFAASNFKDVTPLTDSLKVYGLARHGKFEKLVHFLGDISAKKQKVHKFAADTAKNCILAARSKEDKPVSDDLLAKFNALKIDEMTNNDAIDVEKALEKLVLGVQNKNLKKDIEQQGKLFQRWMQEQDSEMKQQERNFYIEAKKKEFLTRLDELERKEEILTYFENKDRIVTAYYNQGFPREFPSHIPLEKEEKEFEEAFERHHKRSRHRLKPEYLTKISNNKKNLNESLTKIYKTQV